ncbi:MAG TPA: histidine kinase, partial [Kineosporiaceae bacterium]|nr:histidine kinase [Kineosporiaceae bacterium]
LQGLAVAAGLVAVEEGLSRGVPGWEPVDGLALSIALASIAIWGISGMIERNVALARAQATIAELAVQAERSRFARDLHDVLGHSLTVLTVKAELAGRLVAIDPARAEAEIGEVEQLARQALADVRAAVGGYREVTLPGELAAARAALDAAGIAADLSGTVDAVPADRRQLLAWAVREGVTNAVRHSAARHVWLRLDADGVEVTDDGRGPAGSPEPDGVPGNGIAGLRERAAAVGAAVTVSRREGGGFVLRVGW